MERVLRGQHAHNNIEEFSLGFFSVIMAVAAVGVYYKKEIITIKEKFQNYDQEIDLV